MAKAKLLLVEDDLDLVKMYEKKFLLDDFEVEIAYDGEEGLKKAKETKPDMIILDVMLPKLDGLTLFRKLRKQAKTYKTPVLFLTNFDQEDAIFECFSLGAVDYLVKAQVTPAQVVEKIEKILETLKERKTN